MAGIGWDRFDWPVRLTGQSGRIGPTRGSGPTGPPSSPTGGPTGRMGPAGQFG